MPAETQSGSAGEISAGKTVENGKSYELKARQIRGQPADIKRQAV